MSSVVVDKAFAQNPKPILQYRKDSLLKMEELDNPNIGKQDIQDFLTEDLSLENVLLTRSNHIPDEVKPFIKSDRENIIIVKDGNVVFDSLSNAFDDLYINDFNSAYDERPELIAELLRKEENSLKPNRMTALNGSYFTSGLLIAVPNNVFVDEEVRVFYIQENTDMIHRTIVKMADNTNLKISEYYVNNAKCYTNVMSDLYVGRNARLEYIGVDNFTEESTGYIAMRGAVEKEGTLLINHAFLSHSNLIGDISVDLVDEYATVDVSTIGVSDKNQKMNINIDTWNNAKHTSSNIKNYGVALDRSKLVFNNAGKIENGMKRSKAYQSTKGVILNPKASLEANPFLLIDEFDVEAGHGATIGAFDAESMFYLMSRGLARQDAEAMIVSGFIRPIVAKIKNEMLKTQVQSIIDQKMGE